MQNGNDRKGGTTDERSRRLAAELRENLRRRKAQQRGRRAHESANRPVKPGGTPRGR